MASWLGSRRQTWADAAKWESWLSWNFRWRSRVGVSVRRRMGVDRGNLQDRAHRRLKVHDVFQRQFFGRMNVAVQNGLEQIGVF